MQQKSSVLKVAVLGCGTVGTQVVRLLTERSAELAPRIGQEFELVGVAVRSLETERDASVPRELLTTDALSLIATADIVV